ncbi:hypothetical protein TWF481_009989 [Arthrobotrys musiformis]|uniref:N-acetyltransferase domain-containing protein n=1 Tax=Arthrobotrys musiformis TaxID=47236 RepID=A0AAV9W0S5_9PEZI
MANSLMKKALGTRGFSTAILVKASKAQSRDGARKLATASALLFEPFGQGTDNPIATEGYCWHNPDVYHNSPPGFTVREAKYEDAEELTRLWFSSRNSSPNPDAKTSKWWSDVWNMGIQAGPNVVKTFVTENKDNKIVAFSRWNVPQIQSAQSDAPLPEFPDEWGAELTEALWSNAARNREDIMGHRPHWSKPPLHTTYSLTGSHNFI